AGRAAPAARPSARGAGAALLPRPDRGRDRPHAGDQRRLGQDPRPPGPRRPGPLARGRGGRRAMTIEDRLRRAIDTPTSSVEPSDDGLERITEKLLDQRGPA